MQIDFLFFIIIPFMRISKKKYCKIVANCQTKVSQEYFLLFCSLPTFPGTETIDFFGLLRKQSWEAGGDFLASGSQEV